MSVYPTMIAEELAAPVNGTLSAEAASRIVEDYIADRLGNLALAGAPQRMIFPLRAVWIVPIFLAYPGYGLAGMIGVAAVEDELAGIVGATPVDEMRRAAEQLVAEHGAEIEAAFRRVGAAN